MNRRDPDTVSQSDIYRAIGVLEGKVDSLHSVINSKSDDLGVAFKRISELEKSVSKAVGIAIACSVILPLTMQLLGDLRKSNFETTKQQTTFGRSSDDFLTGSIEKLQSRRSTSGKSICIS